MRSVVLVAVVGCGARSGGEYFVRNAYVRDFDLVVERCKLDVQDNQLVVFDCATKTQRLPRITYGSVLSASGDEPASPTRVLASVRDVLSRCATDHGVTGTVTVRLAIDATGRITQADGGDADVATCMTAAFANVRFPTTPAPTSFEFSLLVKARP